MDPKQLQEVTRQLARASGVKEEEVTKVLAELGVDAKLGVADDPSLRPTAEISMKALKSAVKTAFVVIIQ